MQTLNALSHGLLDGGCGYATNFPGFKSQKIFELLGGTSISINEKIAYEMAYGASLAGTRSVVSVKNVGLNVAADPFLNSLVAGVNAGMVVIITEDVDVSDSQMRQDSRSYRDFMGGLWLEPSSLQEAYDFGHQAFEWSELIDMPVVIRVTNRTLELEGSYKRKTPAKHKRKPVAARRDKFIVHPQFWRAQYDRLSKKRDRITSLVEDYYQSRAPLSRQGEEAKIVIGASGRPLDAVALQVSMYPLPEKAVRAFAKDMKSVEVLEQGGDYAAREVKRILSADTLKIHGSTGDIPDLSATYRVWKNLEMLFSGLKSAQPDYVVGDLTQFTVESLNVVQACLCLGASVSTALGMALNGVDYPFAIVGDASFLHGGVLALSEAQAREASMGIVVIDNGGSWCTGGQPTTTDINMLPVMKQARVVRYADLTPGDFQREFERMKANSGVSLLIVDTNEARDA